MNVINQENNPGNSRGRGRCRSRGKPGTLTYNQKALNLIPKYKITNSRRLLIDLGTLSSSTPPKNFRRRRQIPSSSSSATKNTKRSRTTDTASGTTPMSTSTDEQFVIVAITSGRGQARGEVGIAAIDIQYPHMTLCQLSDDNAYTNALTKIHLFQPIEILMPNTMGKDHSDPKSLYNAIKLRFPEIEITEILRTHWNAANGFERIQNHCIKELSSIELIVKQKYYALSAVCSLFKYIESIQHIIYTQNAVKFEYQAAQNATIIDLESAQNLELVRSLGNKQNFCLFGALNRCSTPAGRRLLRASILQPTRNVSLIVERQQCVDELVSNKSLYAFIHPVIRRLSTSHRLLNFVTQQHPDVDTVESAERNLNYALLLKQSLDIIPELKTALNTAQSEFFKQVLKNLNNENLKIMRDEISMIIHPDACSTSGFTSSNYHRCFAIKAGLSDSLDIARQTYYESIDDMHKLVEDLGNKHNLGLNLSCSPTLGYHIEMRLPRNFKFEIEKLSEEFIQAHIKAGVLYMTTRELFVRSQHIKEAYDEIHLMSNLILIQMFDNIRGQIGCLFQFSDDIAGIDLILSLAEVSSIPDFVRPIFGPNLEVKNGKHPIMEILGNESPAPNDIIASIAYNFHTITGPNMSGKTIYLKQIVLLHIMAQIGCFVPATSAQFRISDHIFCRIGARDEMELNASSFVLEVKEIQYILQSLTENSLIVLDELCRSTTVEEGASIAWAICKKFLLSNAFTFHATHFEYLFKLADIYPNVTNHYFEAIPHTIDDSGEVRLTYSHHLKKGIQTIKHYGFLMAKATGMPESVLKDAENFIEQIERIMEINQQFQHSNKQPSDCKNQKNYDKIANVYEKLEGNSGENDIEIYQLVRGLESMSYEEPTLSETENSSKIDKINEETSGLYSAGPEATEYSRTSSKKTSTSSSQTDTGKLKKLVKRQVTFSSFIEPKSKLSKLDENQSTSFQTTRNPLKPMNLPESSEKSTFKIPKNKKPLFLKKNLVNDLESPLFIPRSQPNEKFQKITPKLNERSSSSGSSIEIFPKTPENVSLTSQYSTNSKKSPQIQKKYKLLNFIPQTFHNHYQLLKSKSPVQEDEQIKSLPISKISKESRDNVIASLPQSLRPVGDNCLFTEDFKHFRHILKNVYQEKEEKENKTKKKNKNQPEEYCILSDTVKRSANNNDAHNDIKKKCELLQNKEISPGSSDQIMIVLSSDDEEGRASKCSTATLKARLAVEQKEAEIFKIIETQQDDSMALTKNLKNNSTTEKPENNN